MNSTIETRSGRFTSDAAWRHIADSFIACLIGIGGALSVLTLGFPFGGLQDGIVGIIGRTKADWVAWPWGPVAWDMVLSILVIAAYLAMAWRLGHGSPGGRFAAWARARAGHRASKRWRFGMGLLCALTLLSFLLWARTVIVAVPGLTHMMAVGEAARQVALTLPAPYTSNGGHGDEDDAWFDDARAPENGSWANFRVQDGNGGSSGWKVYGLRNTALLAPMSDALIGADGRPVPELGPGERAETVGDRSRIVVIDGPLLIAGETDAAHEAMLAPIAAQFRDQLPAALEQVRWAFDMGNFDGEQVLEAASPKE
jgi:hypothetical protein